MISVKTTDSHTRRVFGATRRIRLFCFPYAGGMAHVFSRWENTLPGVQIFPIELPGHGQRLSEPLIDSVHKLAATLLDEITPLESPYVFYGHSMGALIAFELIRLLQRQRQTGPMHLFVSAQAAPHCPRYENPIHNLPDEHFVNELQKLNGTPDEVLSNEQLRELFLPILRNDFKVCETYTLESVEKIQCPITVYGGEDDIDISQDDLGGWQQHTTAATVLKMCPGDHFFIRNNESEFLHQFRSDLLRIQKNQL